MQQLKKALCPFGKRKVAIPVLYKYKEISDFTKQLLEENKIYLPINEQLNDPFECENEYYGKNNII